MIRFEIEVDLPDDAMDVVREAVSRAIDMIEIDHANANLDRKVLDGELALIKGRHPGYLVVRADAYISRDDVEDMMPVAANGVFQRHKLDPCINPDAAKTVNDILAMPVVMRGSRGAMHRKCDAKLGYVGSFHYYAVLRYFRRIKYTEFDVDAIYKKTRDLLFRGRYKRYIGPGVDRRLCSPGVCYVDGVRHVIYLPEENDKLSALKAAAKVINRLDKITASM